MTNKKLILGIAAGVAALAVAGIICKRKGYLDGWFDKAEELGDDLRDKYRDVKESAKRKFDEVVQKGGELADKMGGQAEDKATGRTSGNAGNINPATT